MFPTDFCPSMYVVGSGSNKKNENSRFIIIHPTDEQRAPWLNSWGVLSFLWFDFPSAVSSMKQFPRVFSHALQPIYRPDFWNISPIFEKNNHSHGAESIRNTNVIQRLRITDCHLEHEKHLTPGCIEHPAGGVTRGPLMYCSRSEAKRTSSTWPPGTPVCQPVRRVKACKRFGGDVSADGAEEIWTDQGSRCSRSFQHHQLISRIRIGQMPCRGRLPYPEDIHRRRKSSSKTRRIIYNITSISNIFQNMSKLLLSTSTKPNKVNCHHPRQKILRIILSTTLHPESWTEGGPNRLPWPYLSFLRTFFQSTFGMLGGVRNVEGSHLYDLSQERWEV